MHLNISQLADQVRDTPLRDVLAHYGFDVKPEGTTLRAKTERHNIVVTESRWFDNKAGVGGGGAIDLVMHIAGSISRLRASLSPRNSARLPQVRPIYHFLAVRDARQLPRRNPSRS